MVIEDMSVLTIRWPFLPHSMLLKLIYLCSYPVNEKCFCKDPTMLTCVFHGQCVDVVLQDYAHAPKEGPLLAVVHYAIATDEGSKRMDKCCRLLYH